MANFNIAKVYNFNSYLPKGVKQQFSLDLSEYKEYVIGSIRFTCSFNLVASDKWTPLFEAFYSVNSSKSSYVDTEVSGNGSQSYSTASGVKGTTASVECGAYHGTGTLYKITLNFAVSADLTISPIFPVSGDRIPWSVPVTFSWENNLPDFATVSNQTIYWKKTTDSTYSSASVTNNSNEYTFSAGTFDNGSYNWYVSVVDSGGNTTNSAVQTVEVGIEPSLTLYYPMAINLKNDIKQVFTWEMLESVATGQKSYEIGYKKKTATEWTTITRTSSNQYHEFSANTFETAEYDWRVKVTNNDNNSTDYVSSSFNAIGATGAPVITSVTNSAIPTFTWTITSQDTFELEVFSGQNRLFSSGVCVGNNVRTYTPNIMLKDGSYIVKMRAMNEYGYFTDWLEYSFILNTTKPSAYACYVYANDKLGVEIARSLELDEVVVTPTTSTATIPAAVYVLRRIVNSGSDFEVIGKLSPDDEIVTFTDNTVTNGVSYEYAVRNFKADAGYTDSNSVVIRIDYSGLCIYDTDDLLNLYKTEDRLLKISYSDALESAYTHTIGRVYPIKESSEFATKTINVSCFATYQQYAKLVSMQMSGEDLWYKDHDNSFAASVDGISISNTLNNTGYTLSLSLSRIDEEELKLF